MTFGTPAALLLTLIALPITLLYLLRVRVRKVPISTDMFWSQVFEQRPPRNLWQKFRHLTSWLMQMTLLLAISIAAADPRWGIPADEAAFQVLILDTTASMQAEEKQGTRFRQAQEQAKRLVSQLRPGQQAAVLSTNSEAQIECGFTAHIPALLQAIEAMAPTDCSGTCHQAVELATSLLQPSSGGRIVLFTDSRPTDEVDRLRALCEPHPSDEAAGRCDLQIVRLGQSQSNLGITMFEASRAPIDPVGYELLIEFANRGDKPVTARVEITLNDVLVDVIRLQIEANENDSRLLRKLSAEGGVLEARIRDIQFSDTQDPTMTDGLQTDNTAFAVLSERPPLRVLLVSPGNLFLRQALQAVPGVDLTEFNELPSVEADWQGHDLIVLHRLMPSVLPEGRMLIVDPQSDCNLWTVNPPERQPLIVQQNTSSPLMTNIDFGNVLIPQAGALTFTGTVENLVITDTDNAILSLCQSRETSCVVLSVSLSDGDLPMRTVFPLLVSNVVQWFTGNTGISTAGIRTGAKATVALPANWNSDPTKSMTEVFLRSPQGDTRTAVRREGIGRSSSTIELPSLKEQGVWNMSVARPQAGRKKQSNNGDSVVKIPVNLASQQESDLRFSTQTDSLNDSIPLVGMRSQLPPWLIAVILAGVLLALEWWLYQRRLIM